MNYEQKYKEALNKIKPLYEQAKRDGNPIWSTYEYLMPKLRESEDERIRKELHKVIYRSINDPNLPYEERDFISKSVLPYVENLEKQKEEKLDSIRIKCKEHDERHEEIRVTEIIESIIRVYGKTQGEFIAGYDIDTLIHWVREAFDCLNKQNIQKEQKPAEWTFPYGVNETVDKLIAIAGCLEMDGDCLFNGYTGTECGKFLRELARKQIECKPAEWSDEDEKMLVHVVELLELNCDFSEINNEISWLKSLSRKKIWNKEDERILKGIVGLIDHNQHYDVSNKDMLNWLKSLRPLHKRDGGDDYKKGYTEGYNKGYKDANESVSYHFPVMPTTPSGFSCDGTHCTNPHMDCINCPIKTTGGINTVSSSGYLTLKAEWKPSEEQMEALEETINQDCVVCNGDRKWIKPNLESLYEQLKKMKAPKGVPPIESIQK